MWSGPSSVQSRIAAMMAGPSHRHWPLALVLALAALALFTNLVRDYLWSDQGDTAIVARSILVHGVPTAWDGVSRERGQNRSGRKVREHPLSDSCRPRVEKSRVLGLDPAVVKAPRGLTPRVSSLGFPRLGPPLFRPQRSLEGIHIVLREAEVHGLGSPVSGTLGRIPLPVPRQCYGLQASAEVVHRSGVQRKS